jgi:dipeptidyl aminopeptidase/acylaminoacyl peptidase
MQEEQVEFFSFGHRLDGVLRRPDDASGRLPTIVQGPGWLGLARAKTYEPWHRAFTNAGYAVLAFDYRGFGASEGDRGWILPDRMVEDIVNAVSWVTTRPDLDGERIGLYGIGGIGGGNAIIAASMIERVRCVAVQSVVADGREWLRRMRSEADWIDYVERVAVDAQNWVSTGESALVNPRTDISVATPERRAYTNKQDVDSRMEPEFHLQSASALMRYRPLTYVSRLSPRAALLLTSVENDSVTPEDHANLLYEAAGPPKRLIRQTGTTHYRSYTDNYEMLSDEIVSWFDRYLADLHNKTSEELT